VARTMSAHATVEPSASEHAGARRDALLTIVAAIVCGLGIFGVFYWLYTFDWIYFPSVALVMLGCYLLFTRITGPDQA